MAQVVHSQATYADVLEEYIETLLELRHSEIEISGMMLFDGLNRPKRHSGRSHRRHAAAKVIRLVFSPSANAQVWARRCSTRPAVAPYRS